LLVRLSCAGKPGEELPDSLHDDRAFLSYIHLSNAIASQTARDVLPRGSGCDLHLLPVRTVLIARPGLRKILGSDHEALEVVAQDHPSASSSSIGMTSELRG
jgi:hypothetical protein